MPGKEQKKIEFEELDGARRLLHLPERASIRTIKENYRILCQEWHPDLKEGEREAEEKMQEINAAYRLIMEYVESYEYSFARDDVTARFDPESWWASKFYDPEWIGGGKKE